MEELVHELNAIEGGDLRLIMVLDGVDYELPYVRDDLDRAYSDEDFDRARNIIMANQVSSDDFAEIGTFGDFNAQALFYEGASIFLFPTSRYDGVAVSFDGPGSLPMSEIIEIVDDYLSGVNS